MVAGLHAVSTKAALVASSGTKPAPGRSGAREKQPPTTCPLADGAHHRVTPRRRWSTPRRYAQDGDWQLTAARHETLSVAAPRNRDRNHLDYDNHEQLSDLTARCHDNSCILIHYVQV